MNKKISRSFLKITSLFLVWRLVLVFCLIFALNYIPLGYKDRFLGGGAINYYLAPEIFSWANFDGEHYLSIAIFGYKGLEQAFFPTFPMLISFFSQPFSADLLSAFFASTFIGLIISHLSFLLALIFLWQLIRFDFKERIAYLTILLLLIFPTSFYFAALYNESLFLLLSVLSFYFARKGNWLLAGVFGAISSATRIFGLIIFPSLILEALKQKAKIRVFFWIFFIPAGLLVYMLYQWVNFGDPFLYYKLQKIVGEQHQSGLIFLPQVYFRYLNMILTVEPTNPIFQTVVLEFIIGILFFLLPIYGYFKKIRLSYLFYAMIGFLLPTIQGSFSSVPRYVIVFFPSFIILALWFDQLPKLFKVVLLIISLSFLILETTLFLRGYWVA